LYLLDSQIDVSTGGQSQGTRPEKLAVGAQHVVSRQTSPIRACTVKSQLPVPKTTQFPPPSPAQSVNGRSPRKTRSGSPSKTLFLSKDSNLTQPIDWNGLGIENRLAAMEGFYEVMKSQMEGTSFERNSMKELMEQMRARSEWSTLKPFTP
jgi:hypothetical protein